MSVCVGAFAGNGVFHMITFRLSYDTLVLVIIADSFMSLFVVLFVLLVVALPKVLLRLQEIFAWL